MKFRSYSIRSSFRRGIVSLTTIAVVGILSSLAQAADKERNAIAKEINGLVDQLPEVAATIRELEGKLQNSKNEGHADAARDWQRAIDSRKSQIRSIKVHIDKLLDKLCNCCAKKPQGTPIGKDCNDIARQINGLVDQLPEVAATIRELEGKLQNSKNEGHADAARDWQRAIDSRKSQIRSIKVHIDKLLDRLCACCGKSAEPKQAIQPGPTPSTTDKVTDILKTIGGSVSIDIGGRTGGGDHRHHGEDRHRTADKVSTDSKAHKASPSTTSSHKTVTAGCKCHPCTCSPCTCH